MNEPDYGGADFPDGWESAWPAVGCPDPTLLCLEGPGGYYQIPEDDDPCLDQNAPAYCTNPCDAVDVGGILSLPSIQMKMEELWISTGYDQYPNSPEMRVEQGAFIYKGLYSDFYSLKPLSSYPNMVKGTGPCHIDFEVDLGMLQSTGVIYFIHTHPARKNENLDCLDGLPRTYNSEIYDDDYTTISKMNTAADVIGVMIDNDNIIFYNESGPIKSVDRCGY